MSLSYFLGLLEHEDRIEALRRGIEAEVERGDRVLDLGCGLGTFSFFAARAGAGRVVAVDGDPVLHVARSVARANGLEGRIDFVRGRIPDAEVGSDFDVLLFEDFPIRLLDDRTHRLLRRVEDELLAPGARAVPRSARLCIAPVQTPEAEPPGPAGASGATAAPPPADPSGPEEGAASDGAGWKARFRRYGIDWSPVHGYVANEPRSVALSAATLLAAPETGPALSLLPVPEADALRVAGSWELDVGARVDALLLWFDLEAAPGEWISNAPGPRTGPWGQIALPLDPPLRSGGDGVVEAEIWREPFSDGAPGWLAWRAASGQEARSGHEFAAYPAALEDLYPDGSVPSDEPLRRERGEDGR